MRTSSRRGPGRHGLLIGGLAVLAVSAAACSSAPPSVAPTVAPTPIVTPDPHLTDPTTADAVYRGLGEAGLRITANNASSGEPGSDLIRRINATYLGWPLSLSEYRSSAALAKATDWAPGEKPGQGEAPVALAASNILVLWGPQTGAHPAKPDARQSEGLADLVSAMDRLLSPLRARTVVAVTIPGSPPAVSVGNAASPGETGAQGEATPKP